MNEWMNEWIHEHLVNSKTCTLIYLHVQCFKVFTFFKCRVHWHNVGRQTSIQTNINTAWKLYKQIRNMTYCIFIHINNRKMLHGYFVQATNVCSGIKQGCVLAPTLFGIFVLLLMKANWVSTDRVYLHTRSGGRLFTISFTFTICLEAKTKPILVHDMLFTDDAALTSHTEEQLRSLTDDSLAKHAKILVSRSVLNRQTWCCMMLWCLLLSPSVTALVKCPLLLPDWWRVWCNETLTEHTAFTVYRACVVCTLLYDSESLSQTKKRLNSFHMHSLWSVLGMLWKD